MMKGLPLEPDGQFAMVATEPMVATVEIPKMFVVSMKVSRSTGVAGVLTSMTRRPSKLSAMQAIL